MKSSAGWQALLVLMMGIGSGCSRSTSHTDAGGLNRVNTPTTVNTRQDSGNAQPAPQVPPRAIPTAEEKMKEAKDCLAQGDLDCARINAESAWRRGGPDSGADSLLAALAEARFASEDGGTCTTRLLDELDYIDDTVLPESPVVLGQRAWAFSSQTMVRAHPSPDAGITAVLPTSTMVQVLQTDDGGWARVRVEGDFAWVGRREIVPRYGPWDAGSPQARENPQRRGPGVDGELDGGTVPDGAVSAPALEGFVSVTELEGRLSGPDELRQRALQLADGGRYSEALAVARRAYLLSPSTQTLQLLHHAGARTDEFAVSVAAHQCMTERRLEIPRSDVTISKIDFVVGCTGDWKGARVEPWKPDTMVSPDGGLILPTDPVCLADYAPDMKFLCDCEKLQASFNKMQRVDALVRKEFKGGYRLRIVVENTTPLVVAPRAIRLISFTSSVKWVARFEGMHDPWPKGSASADLPLPMLSPGASVEMWVPVQPGQFHVVTFAGDYVEPSFLARSGSYPSPRTREDGSITTAASVESNYGRVWVAGVAAAADDYCGINMQKAEPRSRDMRNAEDGGAFPFHPVVGRCKKSKLPEPDEEGFWAGYEFEVTHPDAKLNSTSHGCPAGVVADLIEQIHRALDGEVTEWASGAGAVKCLRIRSCTALRHKKQRGALAIIEADVDGRSQDQRGNLSLLSLIKTSHDLKPVEVIWQHVSKEYGSSDDGDVYRSVLLCDSNRDRYAELILEHAKELRAEYQRCDIERDFSDFTCESVPLGGQ